MCSYEICGGLHVGSRCARSTVICGLCSLSSLFITICLTTNDVDNKPRRWARSVFRSIVGVVLKVMT
jgi:hypothetical protein